MHPGYTGLYHTPGIPPLLHHPGYTTILSVHPLLYATVTGSAAVPGEETLGSEEGITVGRSLSSLSGP